MMIAHTEPCTYHAHRCRNNARYWRMLASAACQCSLCMCARQCPNAACSSASTAYPSRQMSSWELQSRIASSTVVFCISSAKKTSCSGEVQAYSTQRRNAAPCAGLAWRRRLQYLEASSAFDWCWQSVPYTHTPAGACSSPNVKSRAGSMCVCCMWYRQQQQHSARTQRGSKPSHRCILPLPRSIGSLRNQSCTT